MENEIRGWSNIELDFLRDNYSHATHERLEFMLSRAFVTISRIAKKLGLKRGVTINDGCLADFREFYPTHSNKEVAARFRMTERMVEKVATHYGLEKAEGFVARRNVKLSGRPWTDEEIQVLKDMYATTKNREIPIARSVAQIVAKARELDLDKAPEHMFRIRKEFGASLRRKF